jgi:hypothetical protein
MVFLATELRPPSARDAIVRLAADSGAAGIHMSGGTPLDFLTWLTGVARGVGLAVGSLVLPLPERALSGVRRLPRLAAPERDERTAAIELATQGLLASAAAEVRFAVLDFGPVTLSTPPGAIARAFARRELGEDEPGEAVWAAAVDERRARAPALADACLWALEALTRAAEPVGVRLVLPTAPTPWEVPSPRESGALLETFAGAGVGAAWDPGKLSVLCALGLPISDKRLAALAETAVLVLDNDAVGIGAGYLPGLGERDPRVAAIRPPATVPRIVLGGPGSTDAEVAAAVARAAASV